MTTMKRHELCSIRHNHTHKVSLALALTARKYQLDPSPMKDASYGEICRINRLWELAVAEGYFVKVKEGDYARYDDERSSPLLQQAGR